MKPIETGEVLNGGKILLTENVRDNWVMGQYEVVDVGDDPICDREDCDRFHIHRALTKNGFTEDLIHPTDARLQPGAWILAKPRTAIDSGTRDVFFLAIDDVIGIMA